MNQMQPMAYTPVPTVYSADGKAIHDIYSRMLKDRVVFFHGAVHEQSVSVAIAQLLYLEAESDTKPIHLHLASPGGAVSSGLGLIDVLQFINAPVHTYCVGMCASMGAVLLAAGEKGHRYSLPHSRIMIHQPLISGGLSGQQSDIEIHAVEMLKTRKTLEEMLAEYSGQSYEKVHTDCERDRYMSAEEALEYGLIDKILTKMPRG